MHNKRAFICHGGLGDVYIALLKIKNLELTSCDIYYRDVAATHLKDIQMLCESQPEIKKFDALRIEQTDKYLNNLKKELESKYDKVSILSSTLTNISNTKELQLPDWVNPYEAEYVTINTGAGDWTMPDDFAHNANRRWNYGELQSVVEGIATKTGLSVILIGRVMLLPPFNNKKIINESEKNIIEQLNIIKHAKLNIGFEGFNLVAAMSFNTKMVVKNNPPNHDFKEKKVRYLDDEAYANMIVLDNWTPREFLPIMVKLRNNQL
tara:strand:+ start:2445 stop:3239 length:795 start_codon:yes stop_codon:yes gene_type:complete